MYLWKKRQGKLQLFSWKQENTGLLDETKNVEIGKKQRMVEMCYFKTIFNFGYTKANQTCQRTKRLFMTDLLQNGSHENVKLCY